MDVTATRGNVVVVALFALSWWLRRPSPGAPGTTPIIVSAVAVAIALVTGWLGGELVDRLSSQCAQLSIGAGALNLESRKEITMRQLTRIVLSLTVALALLPGASYATTKSEFQDAMRRLWSDHVAYTRLFIVDAVAGTPDKDAHTQRLLQNQADIANAVAGFHMLMVADVLTKGIEAQFPSRFSGK